MFSDNCIHSSALITEDLYERWCILPWHRIPAFILWLYCNQNWLGLVKSDPETNLSHFTTLSTMACFCDLWSYQAISCVVCHACKKQNIQKLTGTLLITFVGHILLSVPHGNIFVHANGNIFAQCIWCHDIKNHLTFYLHTACQIWKFPFSFRFWRSLY